MSLKNWSLALFVAALVAPLSASALGVSVASAIASGPSNTLLDTGETITFNLVLENATAESVNGLGVGAWGYDLGAPGNPLDNPLIFISGSGTAQAFSAANTGAGGVAFGGLQNTTTSAVQLGAPFPYLDPLRVQLFNGVSTAGANGDTSQDLGIASNPISSGDVHMQVTFVAYQAGTVNLTFGVGQFGNAAVGTGGASLPFTNASYTVTVVPEPGTALLMGLGLAGLALGSRRD
jgi:hypothetical protein